MGVVSKCLTWLLNMRSMILVILVLGLLINESLCAAGVVAALSAAGAKIFNGIIKGGGGGGELWQLQSGQIIDANNCWEDGQGHCPNGNCLDDDGRSGIVVKETIVDCGWGCKLAFVRQHCKVQICCVSVPGAVSSSGTGRSRRKRCKFPFTMNTGRTYYACTRDGHHEGKLWCSTKTDSAGNHVRNQR